ncbi:MAG: S8 family serine peptidase [Cyanobacteria bacterium P01_D01_bin.73]
MKRWFSLAGGAIIALPLVLMGIAEGVRQGERSITIGERAIAAAPKVNTTGPEGIDARRLHRAPFNLLGRKVALGQVEIGRPGQYAFDKGVTRSQAFSPAGLFLLNQRARPDEWLDGHAHAVAGVMLARHKEAGGVAPEARLYAAATGFGAGQAPNGQARECLASQTVAQQQEGGVRAINFSFGEPLAQDRRIRNVLDGNALLTLCVDWSARVHDVLYTIAGNQGGGGISIPTDTFNGINIASTGRFEGKFSKVDYSNLGNVVRGVGSRLVGRESNTNGRGSVGLVAPGADVALLRPDGGVFYASGTSFAAPHVAGVVGLLQELGDSRNAEGDRQWTLDSQRHQVMKAVLLNSADKVKDPGDGRYLGMSKNIWTEQKRSWLESDAFGNRREPLDAQLGTGQLNAFRAVQQFEPGQWSSGLVPAIGWDFDRLALEELQPEGLAASPEEIAQPTHPSSLVFSQEGDDQNNFNGGRSLGDMTKRTAADPFSGAPAFRDYEIQQPLQGGHFFSATLAWSRHVELVDRNGNKQFDQGESFVNHGLSDLDLYLMPIDDPGAPRFVCASASTVDSVEHIFCPVPKTGRYKLRVVLREAAIGRGESYGLAWWSSPVLNSAMATPAGGK